MIFTLRQATDADIGFLVDLRVQTMQLYLEACGAPATKDEHLRRVRFQFENAQIIQIEDEAIGLFKPVELHSKTAGI